MSIETILGVELSNISGLSGKIFPLTAPKNTTAPYLIYVSSEGQPIKSLDGFDPLKEVRIELNVIGARYGDMKLLTSEVIAKLKSFENNTIGGLFIQELTYQAPVEIYESQVDLYRCVIDTQLYFRE